MLAVWSNLFPPQGETGSWTSDHVLCWEWLLWQEDISSFSTNFIVAGFILVQDVVTHNQFLAFSQKKFIHILLNWCVQSDKEESRASYSPILLMSLCLMFYFLGGLWSFIWLYWWFSPRYSSIYVTVLQFLYLFFVFFFGTPSSISLPSLLLADDFIWFFFLPF